MCCVSALVYGHMYCSCKVVLCTMVLQKTLNTQASGQLSHLKIINPYIHSTPINRILSTAQILLVL